jgi:hypothetical protein
VEHKPITEQEVREILLSEFGYWSVDKETDDEEMSSIRIGATGAVSNVLAAVMGHPAPWHRTSFPVGMMARPTGAKYFPVPGVVATEISRAYCKDVVAIIAWDRNSQMIHTTTYGASSQDKVSAANLGETLAKAAGGQTDLRTTYEDFRNVEAADWAAERERLHQRIQELEQQIAGRS